MACDTCKFRWNPDVRQFMYGLLGLLALLPGAVALAQNSAESFFNQGIAASREGDHDRALRQFQAAHRAGLNTAALHYNLGVSQFRTGDLDGAERAFRRATDSPEMAAPAYYNLGLIALERSRNEEARRNFREATDLARTEQIARLARARINELDERDRRGRAWLSVEAGHDSNVALIPDNTSPLNEDDGFADLQLWGDYRLNGPDGPDIRVQGYLNTRAHADTPEADPFYIEAGPDWRSDIGAWQARLTATASHFSLDSETVEQTVEAGTDFRRPVPGLGELQARARLALARGGPDFGFLDGRIQSLRLGVRNRNAAVPWRLHYDLVHEDRHDVRGNGTFQSASPLRHGISVGMTPALNHRTDLELTVSYRISRFADADTTQNGDTIRREDKRVILESRLSRQFQADWIGSLRLQWLENQSNRDAFDYNRVVLSVAIERVF